MFHNKEITKEHTDIGQVHLYRAPIFNGELENQCFIFQVFHNHYNFVYKLLLYEDKKLPSNCTWACVKCIMEEI